MNRTLSVFLFCCTFASASFAQNTPTARDNGAEPIEITAAKSVEWNRTEKIYTARENVKISQGAVMITSALATADYRESAKSAMDIFRLTATGDVRITSDGNTATGDKAVYDVDQAVATLTGKNLILTSPDQTVTATEKMEYRPNTRQALAVGNAKVVRGKDTLSADMITATFRDNNAPESRDDAAQQAGAGNLEKIEADGNVVIVTPSETLRGARGVYDAATNTAELTGKVKIERGPNILEGERASVNLATNVSTMYAASGGKGQVSGRFYPGSEKAPGAAKADAPSPKPVAAPANPATLPQDKKDESSQP